jgi:RND family efflux transporter MFP subunit
MRYLLSFSVLLLLAACSDSATEPAAVAAPSLSVDVAQLTTRTLTGRIPAAGGLHAWEEMSLGVELSGQRVAEVLVEVGDEVRAGQPLLRLDRRTLEVELRQAQARLAQAQAQKKVAEADLARATELQQRGLMPARDRDLSWAAAEAAKADLLAAQAQRESAELRLGFATLDAPDGGVVSWRGVQPGQVVVAGTELLRLIRQGRIEWRAELGERDLARVSPGMPARLRAADGTLTPGVVRQIAPALDRASRSAVVYVDLPQPGRLRAGMYAQGELLLGEHAVDTLPDAALVERDGFRYVFVVGADDVVAQRRVEIGARQDGLIEIRAGVAAGERVAVSGAGFLGDGDRVRVVQALR